jgi:hypothetical protein
MAQFSVNNDAEDSNTPTSAHTPPLSAPDHSALLAQMYSQIATLTQKLHALETSSSQTTSGLKIKLPKPFSGNRTEFRGFLTQLEMVFSLRPIDYQSDQVKITTFGTLLEGRALSWFLPYVEMRRINSLSWSEFVAQAQDTFGEPCRKLNAESRIMTIVQRGSLVDYISEFSSLAIDVGWSEDSLISHFRRGLSPAILDLMVSHPVPATLQGAITLATALDHRIWENREIKKSRTQVPFEGKNSRRAPPPVVSPLVRDPDAMDLDASRRGPLGAEERARRLRENLCLYCGRAGHRLSTCPTRPGSSLNTSSTENANSESSVGKGEGQ